MKILGSVMLTVLPFCSRAVSEELCLLNGGVALSLVHLFLRRVSARIRVEPGHHALFLIFSSTQSPGGLISSGALPPLEAAFPPAPRAHTATSSPTGLLHPRCSSSSAYPQQLLRLRCHAITCPHPANKPEVRVPSLALIAVSIFQTSECFVVQAMGAVDGSLHPLCRRPLRL